MGRCPADHLLAVEVALGGVDDIQPGVPRVVEQPVDDGGRRMLVADLGAAEAQDTDVQIGPAELPRLDGDPPDRCGMDQAILSPAHREVGCTASLSEQ
jgi:hypothetical protein